MVIAWGRASDRIERGAIGAKAVSYHQKAGNKSSRETLANLRNDQVSDDHVTTTNMHDSIACEFPVGRRGSIRP